MLLRRNFTPLYIVICCYVTTGDHFRWCVERRNNKILEKRFLTCESYQNNRLDILKK